jgi:hypothetical protein
MNELFPPVPEREQIIPRLLGLHEIANQKEFRFNGDREAFAKGSLQDLISLLQSGNVFWFNRNLFFGNGRLSFRLLRIKSNTRFRRTICVRFDNQFVFLWSINEIKLEDVPIFDMLLDSLGRHQVGELEIRSKSDGPAERQIFSSGALHQFLKGNIMLKALTLKGLRLDADACSIIGRIPQSLDSLQLHECDLLNAQQCADGVGANIFGPTQLHIKNCQTEYDFSSIAVQLLRNPRLKELLILETFTRCGNLQALKPAFESCKSLENLRILNYTFIREAYDLNLFFHGVASAPRLRTLSLKLSVFANISKQHSDLMFAMALIASQNTSLENVDYTSEVFPFNIDDVWNREVAPILQFNRERRLSEIFPFHNEDVWNREVAPILQFNRKRRLFQERAFGDHRQRIEQLVNALVSADRIGNHHLHAWLVRYHAGEFCCLRHENEDALPMFCSTSFFSPLQRFSACSFSMRGSLRMPTYGHTPTKTENDD